MHRLTGEICGEKTNAVIMQGFPQIQGAISFPLGYHLKNVRKLKKKLCQNRIIIGSDRRPETKQGIEGKIDRFRSGRVRVRDRVRVRFRSPI